jgi:hypothetical protein
MPVSSGESFLNNLPSSFLQDNRIIMNEDKNMIDLALRIVI